MPGMGILGEGTVRIVAAYDSAVMRNIMGSLFAAHAEDRLSELPRMELCGVVRDGVECLEAVKELRPDVLVLDLEMPRLNGLDVLERLRRESPELPVIMGSSYTEHGARSTLGALAGRLDKCCALRVEEAYDGAVIRPGRIWLAPGDAHMEVAQRGTALGEGDTDSARRGRVRLHQQAPLNHCRPSVDYLFHSAARVYGAGALAFMITG